LAAPVFKSVPLAALQNLPALFDSAVGQYRCVIVDMPPGIFSASEELLLRADRVFLVCAPEVMSLHLARRRVAELIELGVERERLRLVVNRADSKGSVQREEIEKGVGLPVRWVLSDDYAAVSAAALKGELLGVDSTLGGELQKLGRHLLGSEAAPEQSARWRRIFSFGKAE
jgi:pilus assembly protein CpaE